MLWRYLSQHRGERSIWYPVLLGFMLVITIPTIHAQFLGLNFADSTAVEGVHVQIVTNGFQQRGLQLLADTLDNIPSDKVQEGWLSWSFVPADINPHNQGALKKYAFDHFFGFSNEPENVLIDDGQFILDEPMRVALFSWKCVTDECDNLKDVPKIQFVSGELINYHRLADTALVYLTNLQGI